VAFASRWAAKGRVRNPDEKPSNPDLYPVASGITKVREKNYGPVSALFANADGTADQSKSKDASRDAKPE
jgi:hypothetical protein